MLAKYKDRFFSYSSSTSEQEITTQSDEKAYPEFEYEEDEGIFYKSVSEEELSDIFDIHFYVEYDAHLKDTPLRWEVFPEDFEDNGVYLIFAEGFLPEWEIIDKFVCRKLVSFEELKNYEAVFEYRKKDGVCKSIEERMTILSIEEMLKTLEAYREYIK